MGISTTTPRQNLKTTTTTTKKKKNPKSWSREKIDEVNKPNKQQKQPQK